MTTYRFKDDDGAIHEVDFATMMESKDGFITLPDGRLAKRVHDFYPNPSKRVSERTEIVSDALGFPQQQIGQMQEHLKQSGCKGIEFTRDPDVKEFVQVKAGSQREFHRYMRSRGFNDMNSRNGSGAMLTKRDFEAARELALRSLKSKKK